LIGGLGYTPWVLASYDMFPSDLFFVFMLIGGASPTFAALIVTRLGLGKKGAEYLFGQFGRKGFSKWWLVAPILLAFALSSFGILLWIVVAGGVYSIDFMKLAEFPPILISNFLMNMWEEIGWRGYALPALQKKHSALVSSLVVGIFWALALATFRS
jgi:membrane protease YdiL (CAAX protease family)